MDSRGRETASPDHHCDNCLTSFDCKTLATALKVLAAHREEIPNPELKLRYEAIAKALKDARWGYPDGGGACRYADAPREVQALTAELVKIWQRCQFPARNGDDQAVYQEEVRCD